MASVCKEKGRKAPEVKERSAFWGGFVGNLVRGVVGDFAGALVRTMDTAFEGDNVGVVVVTNVSAGGRECVGSWVSLNPGSCVIIKPSSSAVEGIVDGTEGVETKSDRVAPQGIGNKIEGSL